MLNFIIRIAHFIFFINFITYFILLYTNPFINYYINLTNFVSGTVYIYIPFIGNAQMFLQKERTVRAPNAAPVNTVAALESRLVKEEKARAALEEQLE